MPMESRQRDSIMIRLAEESDSEQIWSIFHAIVKEGDTYAFDPATTKEQAKEMWYGNHIRTYVAVVEGKVAKSVKESITFQERYLVTVLQIKKTRTPASV